MRADTETGAGRLLSLAPVSRTPEPLTPAPPWAPGVPIRPARRPMAINIIAKRESPRSWQRIVPEDVPAGGRLSFGIAALSPPFKAGL